MANVADVSVKTIDGQDKSLGDYKGKVLLIVNVASQCGYTPQYAGLEELNKKYAGQGLAVLGFPSNDYGAQEPGSNEEIKSFCQRNFGVSFDMFDKVHAKGDEQHPLYARLTQGSEPKGDVKWNFEKFLIGKNGDIVARFPSSVAPDSTDLTSKIEQELAK